MKRLLAVLALGSATILVGACASQGPSYGGGGGGYGGYYLEDRYYDCYDSYASNSRYNCGYPSSYDQNPVGAPQRQAIIAGPVHRPITRVIERPVDGGATHSASRSFSRPRADVSADSSGSSGGVSGSSGMTGMIGNLFSYLAGELPGCGLDARVRAGEIAAGGSDCCTGGLVAAWSTSAVIAAGKSAAERCRLSRG